MASLVLTRGKQVASERMSFASPPNRVESMSVDDRSTAFVAGDTTLGSPTNVFAKAFAADPTRSGQTVTHVMALSASEFNGNTVRRVALHNAAAAGVSGASTTPVAGVDNLSIAKTSGFSLSITVRLVYS